MISHHPPVAAKRSSVYPNREPTRAVVVDDSTLARFFARNVLAQLGCSVVAEGTSGYDASRLYEAHRPELLLLDLVLPELDGLSAARAILARFPDASIVLCSAFASRDQVLLARETGIASFLLKPLARERLAKTIASVNRTRGGR